MGWLLAAGTPAWSKLARGDLLPDLGGFNLQGALPDLAGQVVLLDVWASWCAPCKASFPALAALHREFAEAGFLVVAISVDRKEREYRQFIERFVPPFPVARDGDQALVAALEPPAMPTSYLIDRQGRVREVHVGFYGARTLDPLRAQIRALVEESP